MFIVVGDEGYVKIYYALKTQFDYNMTQQALTTSTLTHKNYFFIINDMKPQFLLFILAIVQYIWIEEPLGFFSSGPLLW